MFLKTYILVHLWGIVTVIRLSQSLFDIDLYMGLLEKRDGWWHLIAFYMSAGGLC